MMRRCSVAAGATCGILPQERVNCGHNGIWKSACESKGCCWDTTVRDVPWCFKAGTAAEPSTTTTTTVLPDPNCDVGDPKNRVDCSHPGVNELTCRAKGCCWDSSIRSVKWCFRGVYAATPTFTTTLTTTTATTTAYSEQPDCDVGHPTKRIDCGYPGIRPDACRQRKCCWDDSIRGVLWCFYGAEVRPEPNCDVGPPSKRVDCGYPGIAEYTCRQRRCCWDESVLDVPWCYHPNSGRSLNNTPV